MLNVLVDKAIERSSHSKLENHQPIFTISYSVVNSNQQRNNDNKQRSKTVNVNKIPKIIKASEIISQRWKNKTIQKLQNIQIQTSNMFHPSKTNKNSQKSSTKNQDYNNFQTVPIKDTHLSPIQYTSYIEDLRNLTQSPFVIKKKRLQQKSHTMYEKLQGRQLGNSLYLRYRQGLKNKTNKKIAFNKYFYQRRVSEGDAQKSLMHNSGGCQLIDTEENQPNNNNINIIESQNKLNNKNVSFINTIHYKTLPKQQVRPYKIDTSQKQKSRKTSLGHTQNIFVRTKRQERNKNLPQLMNMTISAFASNRQQQRETERSNLLLSQSHQSPSSPKHFQTRGTTSKISVRKVYTEKRTRKNFKDLEMEQLRQQFHIDSKRESYRPWSPIKTNPLYVNNDDYDLLMLGQSHPYNPQLYQIGY